MIYFDNGATSYPKPAPVIRAVEQTMRRGGNPGRGGYGASMAASRSIYAAREAAGRLFRCPPEQVVFTMNGTHGLNLAIHSLIPLGGRVVISGFEHNAVTRPLYALNAKITVAGRRLFCWEDTLEEFRKALKQGADGAVITHVSNVFGYILPVEELGKLCREFSVPWILDAAQSAGSLEVNWEKLGAEFIAMPGHKGLLGPQGTGLLLCGQSGTPLLFGGTGSDSLAKTMPESLPERLEAGTQNTPGIAGLAAGMDYVNRIGTQKIARRERALAGCAARLLRRRGYRVFSGEHQSGTVSFLGEEEPEALAAFLAHRGFALRAGLHCAPLAHESAGTVKTGTVRLSFGHGNTMAELSALDRCLGEKP